MELCSETVQFRKDLTVLRSKMVGFLKTCERWSGGYDIILYYVLELLIATCVNSDILSKLFDVMLVYWNTCRAKNNQ